MAQPLDIFTPISMELDWISEQALIENMLMQKERYGVTKFALNSPCGGWRSVGFPTEEHFAALANKYKRIASELEKHGIECGWWVTTTVKSGRRPEFTGIIKEDGSEHPFANCPLDPAFRARFAQGVALFAEIAKPKFIFTEDDYAIDAAGGCFCPLHLAEFSKRMGKEYTREDIVSRLKQYAKTDSASLAAMNAEERKDYEENIAFVKEWRNLKRDSLVGMAQAVRKALDRKTPEIPMGYSQAWCADVEGNATEPICRAFSGEKLLPFCRFYGTKYGGFKAKEIPGIMFHMMYCRQHIPRPFHFIHEADPFPHNEFFMSGNDMKCLLATAYAQDYDGTLLYTQQLLDDPNEENTFGDTFAKERKRFEAVHQITAQCDRKGVELDYDPFWNTYDASFSTINPLWLETVGLFGVPYTTLESKIAFLDVHQATHFDDETILKYLSKGLFLDGAAAKALCDRGFEKYLGVKVTDKDMSDGMVRWDLGAREVIREPFAGKGKNMPGAHMFAPGGNGKWLGMEIIDDTCEVISEAYTFQKNWIAPTMTRFENELGGKVAVMSLTLDGNHSQAIFNYRRQELIQKLMVWMGGEPAFALEPAVQVIMNEAEAPEKSGFLGMLMMINLSSDGLPSVRIHLPERWRNAKQFRLIDIDGCQQELAWTKTEDGIEINEKLAYLEPMYLVIA